MARALVRVSPWQRRDPGAWLGCGGVAVQDASVDAMPAIDVGVRRGMTSASEKMHRFVAVACFMLVEKAMVASGLSKFLPGTLLGMFALFGFLLTLDASGHPGAANAIFRFLEPGYRFLLKWAPVFFTPALVKLPLVEEHISGFEFFRLAVLIFAGGMLQMAAVAMIARWLASREKGPLLDVPDSSPVSPDSSPQSDKEPYPRPGRPFKRRWLPVYGLIMLVALGLLHFGRDSPSCEIAYMLCASLLAFVLGNSMPAKAKSIFHPIFAGVVGSWLALALWAQQDETRSFREVLVTYSSPGGAGPLMSMLLNPLVVALALLLFERRKLLRRDRKLIIGTSLLGAFSGIFGTALMARLLQLPGPLAKPTVGRYCTAPLALAVAGNISASPPLTVAMVVASGFVGIFAARPLLAWLQVTKSRERGLAIGAVSHVLGTVSLASWDEKAVPYSALCFVLASGSTAAFTSLPPVQALLLWILPA